MRTLLLLPAFALAAVTVARAHSGSDFLSVEDAGIGHPGDGLLGATYHQESYSGGDELSTELAFAITPFPRIRIGADVRVAEDANGDWVYSSVTPRIQFAFTDPESAGRWRIGATVAYQFAEDISVQETVTTYEKVTVYRSAPGSAPLPVASPSPGDEGGGGGGGGATDPVCDPLFDLDCEPNRKTDGVGRRPKHGGHTVITPIGDDSAAAASGGGTSTKRGGDQVAETTTVPRKSRVTRGGGGHQGIHNHDASQWEVRLIAECDVGRTKAVANLIATFPDDDHAYWGYGVGLRRDVLLQGLSIGAEATGDFLPGGEHEIIGTLGYRWDHGLALRAGLGVGLSDESPDATIRIGVLWQY